MKGGCGQRQPKQTQKFILCLELKRDLKWVIRILETLSGFDRERLVEVSSLIKLAFFLPMILLKRNLRSSCPLDSHLALAHCASQEAHEL